MHCDKDQHNALVYPKLDPTTIPISKICKFVTLHLLNKFLPLGQFELRCIHYRDYLLLW